MHQNTIKTAAFQLQLKNTYRNHSISRDKYSEVSNAPTKKKIIEIKHYDSVKIYKEEMEELRKDHSTTSQILT